MPGSSTFAPTFLLLAGATVPLAGAVFSVTGLDRTTARPGDTLRLHGSRLDQVSAVILNGREVTELKADPSGTELSCTLPEGGVA